MNHRDIILRQIVTELIPHLIVAPLINGISVDVINNCRFPLSVKADKNRIYIKIINQWPEIKKYENVLRSTLTMNHPTHMCDVEISSCFIFIEIVPIKTCCSLQ